jgi:hypothetical protein
VQIDVVFVLRAVRAVVTGGRLNSVRAGLIDLAASLSCEGVEIASGSRRIGLADEAGLGAGISLLEYALVPGALAGAR